MCHVVVQCRRPRLFPRSCTYSTVCCSVIVHIHLMRVFFLHTLLTSALRVYCVLLVFQLLRQPSSDSDTLIINRRQTVTLNLTHYATLGTVNKSTAQDCVWTCKQSFELWSIHSCRRILAASSRRGTASDTSTTRKQAIVKPAMSRHPYLSRIAGIWA